MAIAINPESLRVVQYSTIYWIQYDSSSKHKKYEKCRLLQRGIAVNALQPLQMLIDHEESLRRMVSPYRARFGICKPLEALQLSHPVHTEPLDRIDRVSINCFLASFTLPISTPLHFGWCHAIRWGNATPPCSWWLCCETDAAYFVSSSVQPESVEHKLTKPQKKMNILMALWDS